ncbi:hypothetical protein EXIGLDRAFT_780144 [Exidia glandulosa HHB12029]|uniref:Uncharacterized protein n=1 Tax=Exidia glandulosa HHB12029 TaxID=1314781 RepID=A0A165BQT0_EXIGL|nr:hypothetical protein EXIGLDRAFT_780144 [Exidia glandulosa HHB12029]
MVLDRHGLPECLLILAPHSHTLRFLAISEGQWPETPSDRATAVLALEELRFKLQLAVCAAYTDSLYHWSGIFLSLRASCKWRMPRLPELHMSCPLSGASSRRTGCPCSRYCVSLKDVRYFANSCLGIEPGTLALVVLSGVVEVVDRLDFPEARNALKELAETIELQEHPEPAASWTTPKELVVL